MFTDLPPSLLAYEILVMGTSLTCLAFLREKDFFLFSVIETRLRPLQAPRFPAFWL